MQEMGWSFKPFSIRSAAKALGLLAVFVVLPFLAGAETLPPAPPATPAVNDINNLATTTADNSNLIPNFIAYICYICGTAMASWGLLDVKGHVEQPTQRALKIGLSKLALSGLLFALPYVANTTINTFYDPDGSDSVDIQQFASIDGAGGTKGFWDLITKIQTSTQILPDFMVYICYIMATALTAYALFGIRRSVEDPSRNSYKGPVAQLFTAGFLFSVPYMARVIYYTLTSSVSGTVNLITSTYRFSQDASAGTVGSMVDNARLNAAVLPNFAVYIAWVVGVYFVIRGLLMLKDHANDGGRTPIVEPIKRLSVAGMCFAIPLLAETVINSFALKAATVVSTSSNGWAVDSTVANAGGLDGMFVALAKNTVNPLLFAIDVFCYIAGILIIVFGLQRFVKTAQEGARGPLGYGTLSMFVVAAALLAFPHMVGMLGNTIFGTTASLTKITFMSNIGGVLDANLEKQALNVLSACVAFIGVIGYLSVVRGLFIFKAHADGNGQATLFSAVTHLVAGIIAVNLGQFVNYMQNTLGLTATLQALTFS